MLACISIYVLDLPSAFPSIHQPTKTNVATDNKLRVSTPFSIAFFLSFLENKNHVSIRNKISMLFIRPVCNLGD